MSVQKTLLGKAMQLPAQIGPQEILELQESAEKVMDVVRRTMLAPTAQKQPPTFDMQQLLQITGADRNKVNYRLKKGDLPDGEFDETGRKKVWTLADTRKWSRELRGEMMRPAAVAPAVTICVSNFKGGVGKTTTAAVLAQSLSMKGHEVLVIDTDSQGSLTVLFGGNPGVDIGKEQSILPLLQGETKSLIEARRKTYWDGVDMIGAYPGIQQGDYALHTRALTDPRMEFWAVLDDALDPLREHYDVIIIDTPPVLNYTSLNTMMAADGLIVPLPPSGLDFASSSAFWKLYNEYAAQAKASHGYTKHFSFIDVLLTRVDYQDAMASEVRRWIGKAYGEHLLPIEIAKTSIAGSAAAQFGTAYDLGNSLTDKRTWKRAYELYERFVDEVESQIVGIWAGMKGGK